METFDSAASTPRMISSSCCGGFQRQRQGGSGQSLGSLFLAGGGFAIVASRRRSSRRRQLQRRRNLVLRASAAEPLPLPKRLQRSLTFYAGVLPILAQYEFRPMLRQAGLIGDVSEEAMTSEMHEWGSERLLDTLLTLQGFYVKSGQVLSSRVDLFPEQYTKRLTRLQDSLPPVSSEDIRREVERELCGGGKLEELFREFHDEPLGTASIAQVHKAVLRDGREVAVKVVKPNCEATLRGDLTNLKVFAKFLQGKLPVDYYPVFCELERALNGELDMLTEAQSAQKLHASISHDAEGNQVAPPLKVPLPMPGLATRSVLVMEFLKGTPLNRLAVRAKELGIDLNSAAGKRFGKKILERLTLSYGRMVFSSGFIHGDPHPGNIFVLDNGEIALIDCGQVAQLFREQRLLVAEAVLASAEYDGSRPAIERLADVVRRLGATVGEGVKDPDAALAAVVLYLFGDEGVQFPGGYSKDEFSAESPLRALAAFPGELVLLGRAAVLVKGVAARLGVEWSVAAKWAPMAASTIARLCDEDNCALPSWALNSAYAQRQSASDGPRRLRDIVKEFAGSLREWGLQKAAKAVLSRRKAAQESEATAAALEEAS
eukprot:TRINITY_DN73381_c0_g1_i1.p1 TRINITY_DN73381_c0_g1~~TRINITY_DN73381_c0_g1_i1.p1  ORF type:complete len:602 (-),score=155.28 TRINITY_DN73381_c0_g1_i1:68-1873(-)